MKHLMAAILAVPALASTAQAAEITGGTADLSWSAFTQDTGISRATLRGSLEAGFSPSLGTQLDLSLYDFNESDLSAYNATLHGIYHLSGTTTLGAFLGNEELENSTLDFYGLEARHGFASLTGEAYAAFGDEDGESASLLGLALHKDAGSNFRFGAEADFLDLDSAQVARLALNVGYKLNESASFYGEAGLLDYEVGPLSDSRAFVGAGLKLGFGARSGTTFGWRGLLTKVPGL